MKTEPVVYSTGRVHVAFTSPSVIQLSGDARLLQDVKTDLKQFVQMIIHKTVTFPRAGRKISETCCLKGSKRQLFWYMHLEVSTKRNHLKLQLNCYVSNLLSQVMADNLAVDGRQLVAQFMVGAVCLMYMASLCQVSFQIL